MSAKAKGMPETPAVDPFQRMPSCTRCGKRDAVEVEEGVPARMCQECRDYMRQYQQQYRSGDEIRARAEGFKDGAVAMKETLLTGLRKAPPGGMFRNFEVMQWIAETAAPEFKERQQP